MGLDFFHLKLFTIIALFQLKGKQGHLSATQCSHFLIKLYKTNYLWLRLHFLLNYYPIINIEDVRS